MTDNPTKDETIKVALPGERPFVTVLFITVKGFIGRIQNKLFNEYSEHEQAQFMKRELDTVGKLPQLHSYKKGDEIEFEYVSFTSEAYPDEKFYEWRPVKQNEHDFKMAMSRVIDRIDELKITEEILQKDGHLDEGQKLSLRRDYEAILFALILADKEQNP